jgi:hypothetical protein
MYNLDDIVLTVDKMRGCYVITASIITDIINTYERTTYTIDDIWMITDLEELKPDIKISIAEGIILKKVTEDYSKEDIKREYPEYFI